MRSCCGRCRRPAVSRSASRRCSRTRAGASPARRCGAGRRLSTPSRRRSRSGRCSGCAPSRASAQSAFIRATKRSSEPASQRASAAAMLFADGSSSAWSACRSVSRSPAASGHDRLLLCRRRRSVSATSASVSLIVGPSVRPQRVVAEDEIRRHHLCDARDRSGVLVRPRLQRRLPDSTAAWPWAGQTVPGSASRLARRWCGARRWIAGEDEDTSERTPRAAVPAMTASRAATRRLRIRARCVVLRACRLWATAPFKERAVAGPSRVFDMPAIRAVSSIVACAYWSSRTSPTWRRHFATACGSRRSRPTSPPTATRRSSC